MNKSKIYVLHSAPVIGTIIYPTTIEEISICDKCGIKKQPKLYKNVHYEVDSWNGEHIIQGESIFMVTSILKEAFEKNDVKGCFFERVVISKSSFFEMGEEKDSTFLPAFWVLNVIEGYEGPEIWWEKVPCKDCEKEKWNITQAGIISISVPFNSDPVPKRTVYFDSWKGADIFYLQDPDVPIITEKIANILTSFCVEINLLESGWE